MKKTEDAKDEDGSFVVGVDWGVDRPVGIAFRIIKEHDEDGIRAIDEFQIMEISTCTVKTKAVS